MDTRVKSGNLASRKLTDVIQGRVAAEMARNHGISGQRQHSSSFAGPIPNSSDLDRLLVRLVSPDSAAWDNVLQVICRDVCFQEFVQYYVAPLSQMLGDRWSDDSLSFSEVTLASTQLQAAVRSYPITASEEQHAGRRQPCFLLTQLKGCDHPLGLLILSRWFRAHGWVVDAPPIQDDADVLALVRGGQYDLLGLSFCSPDDLEKTARLANRARRVSRSLRVAAGGPGIAAANTSGHAAAFDFVANDAFDALAAAEKCLLN